MTSEADSYRFVCGACGKISRARWPADRSLASDGWDESCSMNAALCRPRTAADVLVPDGCQWVAICETSYADMAFTGDTARAVLADT